LWTSPTRVRRRSPTPAVADARFSSIIWGGMAKAGK
jgi:hypothetical protein